MGSTNVTKAGDSRQVTQTTWAAKPSIKGWYEITDVGINGSIWYYDGAKWIHGSPITLVNLNKGWIIASLAAANAATYSQSGTVVTVTSTAHGFSSTLHEGKSIYLNIASGTASAGWYSNFTYVDGNTFTCVSASSLTTSGTINTNTSAVQITDSVFTVLGGLLGNNGTLTIACDTFQTNSANNKTVSYVFGANTASNIITTNNTSYPTLRIKNRNNEARQSTNSFMLTAFGSNNSSPLYLVNDTSTNKTFSISCTVAAANEFISIENINIKVEPGH